MKVLIYTHEFPPFAAGAGTYSADLAAGLSFLGVEVHVATPFIENMEKFNLGAKKSLVNIHYMSQWRSKNPVAASFFLLRLYLRYSLDLVIVTERGAQETIAKQSSVPFPYVAVIHGTEILEYFASQKANLSATRDSMLGFYSRARLCIAVSNATRDLAQRFLACPSIKIKRVHNGIGLDRLIQPSDQSVLRIRENYGADSELVLCVGRLALDKGHDILLRAFKDVHALRSRARLLICGVGPFEQSLMELRSSLCLDSVVHFLGKIPETLLPAYYVACDLFAMPSRCEDRWEGLGLVYLEANFFERPVVGGNEGGVPEAIADEQSGILTDPRDHASVAEAILRLLGDRALRLTMGKLGKRRVLEYFNSIRMAKETLSQLHNLRNSESFKRLLMRVIVGFGLAVNHFSLMIIKIMTVLCRKAGNF